MDTQWDVVVIGAGASGMMCAATAGYRGKKVLLLDHANRPGKKILMSGGGRCNFTNLNATPDDYRSHDPHFCISALKRYTPYDFLELVERHDIDHVEKAPGQLFCRDSAKPIVEMLTTECEWAGVALQCSVGVDAVARDGEGFCLKTTEGQLRTTKLVIATGGYSIPTLGATGFGFELARQFGLKVWDTRPALVPFTLTSLWKERFAALAGLATLVDVQCGDAIVRGDVLLTHRGISGPAVLDISGDWVPGQALKINWWPDSILYDDLIEWRETSPRKSVVTMLSERLPKRLAQALVHWFCEKDTILAECSNAYLKQLSSAIQECELKPAGTEGWRTAEVTLGGIDTRLISSKDMGVKTIPNLYFIGEVLDVTGRLGGFNFQWAWASGVACGQAI
ncbi:NAD(P)/FAD-dependent oxidoreductase [Zymobacter sp. IVIA_12111.31 C1]|uniref:NAD(P)/FAD-dependent oxidoreductase n=1 Tax=Zymobacter sp. IVIA_12111.31 C1 TaxID=3394854 RepID=UPI0039C4AE00